MERPKRGEFFSPILCGPFRGVPAIHLLGLEQAAPFQEIAGIVDGMTEAYGLRVGQGKGLVFTDRFLPDHLLKAMRDIGLFVIMEIDNADQRHTPRADHKMVSSTTAGKVRSDAQSFVYCPNVEEYVREPDFAGNAEKIPKFLLVPGVSRRLMEFVLNTQYPWSVQLIDRELPMFPSVEGA
jgi:hypothetical protein